MLTIRKYSKTIQIRKSCLNEANKLIDASLTQYQPTVRA